MPERRKWSPVGLRQNRSHSKGEAREGIYRNYVVLFLLIGVVYLATITDTAFDWISDGQVMFDTAVSLHEFGEFGISPAEVDANTGMSGTTDYYGKYGLGLSFVEQIPLWFVSPVEKIFGEGRSNVLFPLMNMLITALSALLVALCLRDLGFRFRTCSLGALGFAFGTPAWPYTSYDFSEPLQALCLVAAFWFILHATRNHPPSPIHVAMGGFALGYAVFTKALLLIVIPWYAIYLWMSLGGAPLKRLRQCAWFLTPLLLWGVTLAALNVHRFGSIFEFGYGGETKRFTTPLLTGLFGLLLSPSKGLIFYAPLSILVLWALWKFRKTFYREVFLFVTVFAVIVVTNSMWWSWEGGISWGPRLLMPMIPLLAVSAAMVIESSHWTLPVFISLAGVGAAINLLGVLVNFLVWVNAVGANQIRLPLNLRGRSAYAFVEHDGKRWVRPPFAMWYIPALSPIRGHAWLLRLRYFGVPFSLNTLTSSSSGPLPKVSFPPVEIDFALLKNEFALSHLRSAHFWLYETVTGQPREEIFTYPVYGISIERQGDRAVAKGDGERAVECYARGAELVPNYASPALKLSRLQVERGRVGEGVETLRRYLSRGDRNQDQERAVRLQLAQIYEKAGYREAALEQYRSYLTLQPSEENRTAIERHIAELSRAHP
ncbi:MAG: hypothetical protein LAO21_15545 [Acidobacteriia bacterium]|nr:hypothetical protein [Terriglobia bacterium]